MYFMNLRDWVMGGLGHTYLLFWGKRRSHFSFNCSTLLLGGGGGVKKDARQNSLPNFQFR